MKHTFLRITLLVSITLIMSSGLAFADKPIQLALFNPVQIFPEDESITGVRLNLIYGKNAALTGLDIGLVNHLTQPSAGLQWGFVSYNESDFTGWQDGYVVNITKGKFVGLQSGFYNHAKDGMGLQWGFINYSGYWNGLMLGFVNYAETMKGIQIGLVNVIRQGGQFPVFPIVNWSL